MLAIPFVVNKGLLVEARRIITLYHGYQVVSGIIVIVGVALLCAHAVDIVLPASAPTVIISLNHIVAIHAIPPFSPTQKI